MRRQRGVVVLELAMVLPAMLFVLAAAIYFCWMSYHYEVVQKAVQAGARYLSGTPAINMKTSASAQHESNLVQALVQEDLGVLGATAAVVVSCDDVPCAALNGALPAKVTVTVLVTAPNIFPAYVHGLADHQFRISRSLRYVGG